MQRRLGCDCFGSDEHALSADAGLAYADRAVAAQLLATTCQLSWINAVHRLLLTMAKVQCLCVSSV
jgi:hypothetical protein